METLDDISEKVKATMQNKARKKRLVTKVKYNMSPQLTNNPFSNLAEQVHLPFSVQMDCMQNADYKESASSFISENFSPFSPRYNEQNNSNLKLVQSLSELENQDEILHQNQSKGFDRQRSKSQESKLTQEEEQKKLLMDFDSDQIDFQKLKFKKQRSKSQEHIDIQKKRAFYGYNAENRCKRQLK